MNDLGFWMAMFTLGALAYHLTPLGALIRATVRLLWSLIAPAFEQPRDALGRYASVGERSEARSAVVTTVLGGNGDRSASERGVPDGNDVPAELTIHEAVLITTLLTRGVSPSNVVKELPGYSARRYTELRSKVDRVKAIWAEVQVEEEVTS